MRQNAIKIVGIGVLSGVFAFCGLKTTPDAVADEPVKQYVVVDASPEDDGEVKVVENVVLKILGETEPREYMSWGITTTGLDEVLIQANAASRGENIKVAVIDTGINVGSATEPGTFRYYFPEKKLEVYDVSSDSTEVAAVQDLNGHGTHVVGTIAEGTPDEVTILAIRASETGDSSRDLYLDKVLTAIDYAIDHGANVINMSFGTTTYIEVLEEYLNVAKEQNVISVAASGNDGLRLDMYPASLESVISVGSVGANLIRAASSNYGPNLEFVAPGVGIESINGVSSGTSMAAPHVAAAVGILKSYNADLTLANVRDLLVAHMRDLGAEGRDEEYGYGIIDVAGADMCDAEEECDEYGVFSIEVSEEPEEAPEVPMVVVENRTGNVAEAQIEDNAVIVTSEKACIVVAEKTDGGFERLSSNEMAGARSFTLGDDIEKIYVILKGDVNMNGKVNVNDSARINLSLLDKNNKYYNGLTELEKIIADVSGNGKINVNDAVMINLALIPDSNRFYAALAW